MLRPRYWLGAVPQGSRHWGAPVSEHIVSGAVFLLPIPHHTHLHAHIHAAHTQEHAACMRAWRHTRTNTHPDTHSQVTSHHAAGPGSRLLPGPGWVWLVPPSFCLLHREWPVLSPVCDTLCSRVSCFLSPASVSPSSFLSFYQACSLPVLFKFCGITGMWGLVCVVVAGPGDRKEGLVWMSLSSWGDPTMSVPGPFVVPVGGQLSGCQGVGAQRDACTTCGCFLCIMSLLC